MGTWRYMVAPTVPYRTAAKRLGVRGEDGLIEFPITVVPTIRLPFFATFLLSTGFELFARSYRALRRAGWPIQFQFHLSDFVDYSHPDLVDQVRAQLHGFIHQRRITLAGVRGVWRGSFPDGGAGGHIEYPGATVLVWLLLIAFGCVALGVSLFG